MSKTWLQLKLDLRNLLKIFYYEMFDFIKYMNSKNNKLLLELEEELKGI